MSDAPPTVSIPYIKEKDYFKVSKSLVITILGTLFAQILAVGGAGLNMYIEIKLLKAQNERFAQQLTDINSNMKELQTILIYNRENNRERAE